MTKLIRVTALSLAIFALATVACSNTENITMSNFDRIVCATFDPVEITYSGGWTYEQVNALLGKPSSKKKSKLFGYDVTAYVWGTASRSISVSFIDGRAISKVSKGIV